MNTKQYFCGSKTLLSFLSSLFLRTNEIVAVVVFCVILSKKGKKLIYEKGN